MELFMYRVWTGKKNFVCYWHGLFYASLEVMKNNFGSPVQICIFTFSNHSLITAVCGWGRAIDVVWIMLVFPVIIQKAAWLLRFPAVFVYMIVQMPHFNDFLIFFKQTNTLKILKITLVNKYIYSVNRNKII